MSKIRKVNIVDIIKFRINSVNDFSNSSNIVNFSKICTKHFKASKRITKTVRSLPIYQLSRYIKYENYLIRKQEFELSFKEHFSDPDHQKVMSMTLRNMNRCLTKYLRQSNMFEIVAFHLNDHISIISIPEMGMFLASNHLVQVFAIPIIKGTRKNLSYFKKLVEFINE